MKQWLQAALVCGICMMIIGVTASFSTAGGVITYKLKIKNDTDDAICSLDVYTYKGWKERVQFLHPHDSKTVETNGMDCFVSLAYGSCFVTGASHNDIKTKCIVGGRETSSPNECLAVACYSSDWFIRRSSDGTYHFHRE
ncbi:MAG: hypothetical protein K4571_15090 [Deltaproteobacteria bacterium]